MPISWMCKKQTSVSHSSTEAQMISLDAGSRMDGTPTLDLWDSVIEVFHSSSNDTNKAKGRESQGNLSRNTTLHIENQNQTKHVNLDLNNVDRVSSNVRSSRFGAVLHVFEDSEAVIKMIIKGRSPTMRYASRIHRVAPDCLFDRINVDTKIQIRYIDTKHQLADILTKRGEWNNLLHLFNISHFSSLCCAQNFSLTSCQNDGEEDARTKRRQDCGKIKAHSNEPDVNCLDKFFIREPSDCVEKSGDTQSIYRET